MERQALAPRRNVVSQGPLLAAAVVTALMSGVLIVVLPPEQGLVVIAGSLTLLALGVASLRGFDDVEMYAGIVLIASSFADFPRTVIWGPLTGLSALSLLYLFAALAMVIGKPARASVPYGALRPFWLFLFWALLGGLWSGAGLRQTQNLLVILVFIITCTVLATKLWTRGITDRRLWGILSLTTALASATYLFGALIAGLGSDPILGARTYALVALTGLAWALSGWRYSFKYSALLSLLVAAGVFASLSRLALGAALVLIFLTWFKLSSVSGVLRSLVVLGIGTFILVNAIARVPVLNERFFSGDVVDVGSSLAVNVSGRANFWGTTWDSFRTSPWVGHGPGSADTLITETYVLVSHPHNDYLRILHDYGIVGMALFGFGMFRLMFLIRKAWARAEALGDRSGARLHLATFLVLVGVLLSMITDNTIAYVFVLAPVGVMVGMSLARIKSSGDVMG